MYQNYKISAVIPCLNEAESIQKVIQAMPAMVDEIIIVDNNSTDDTANRAKGDRVVVVTESRIGYGNAYKAGLAKAVGDIIIGLDGDGQHDPAQTSVLVESLVKNNKNLVVGNRMPNFGKPSDLIWMRYIGNLIFFLIARILFGKGITDTQSGMWALRSSKFKRIKVNSEGMSFSQELKIKMKSLGGYEEIPITVKERLGVSKLSIKNDGVKNTCNLFKLFFQQKYEQIDASFIYAGLVYFGIFIGLVYVIFSQDYLPGGDDLYLHIKYSYLYRILPWSEVTNFPWLQYTFPNDKSVDLWWLFHMLQLPLTYFKDLLVAAQISNVLFIGIFLVAFVKSLKALDIIWRPFWTLLLLFGSQDFFFRLALGRPLTINLVFFLATYVLLYKRKFLWLIVVGALFLLNNVGAVLLIPMVGLYSLVQSVVERKLIWKPSIYLFLGYCIGLLTHPFYPDNIYLTFVQIYHTQFTSILDKVGVGNEIYPYSFSGYISVNGVILLLAIASILIWAKFREAKDNKHSGWWIFGISALTFIMSFKSKRYVEYAIPAATLAIAYTLQPYVRNITFSAFKKTWKSIWEFRLALMLLVVATISFFGWNGLNTYRSLRSAPSTLPFSASAEWMVKNTDPGSIVYNSQWDQFPQLFFWNHHNHYILGMDPTFMYIRDPSMYDKWIIINGEDSTKWESVEYLNKLIGSDFNSSYLFIEDNRNPELLSYIELGDIDSQYFKKAYSNNGITIFSVLK